MFKSHHRCDHAAGVCAHETSKPREPIKVNVEIDDHDRLTDVGDDGVRRLTLEGAKYLLDQVARPEVQR